eukprot:TRINITY_DN27806_c0_g1_i1.p2 TRINITY_DN27806_c0_g1~~TRINITY_DN27806_c0_g1_i1.p2  ORF type:complete len:165 (+),score=35.69 TRINITY_DN27806_c0_g1_i1:1-495(+)
MRNDCSVVTVAVSPSGAVPGTEPAEYRGCHGGASGCRMNIVPTAASQALAAVLQELKPAPVPVELGTQAVTFALPSRPPACTGDGGTTSSYGGGGGTVFGAAVLLPVPDPCAGVGPDGSPLGVHVLILAHADADRLRGVEEVRDLCQHRRFRFRIVAVQHPARP